MFQDKVKNLENAGAIGAIVIGKYFKFSIYT